MCELNEQTDINTDFNSLCELPEGHKGLHVQGTESWTGYARHETALDSDWYANNWPAYWRESELSNPNPVCSQSEQ